MARARRLTDLLVRKLNASGQARLEVWDERIRGLGVRVSPSGTKSFVLLYRLNGRSKRMTLGRYPILSLAGARQIAAEILRKVAHGEDPQALKSGERRVIRFDAVLDKFVQLHCSRQNRQNTARETERLLRTCFLPVWKARDLGEITKHDILLVLDAIVEDGKPSAANHAFAAIRKLFNWCVARGILNASPCAGISTPAPVCARDRVVSDEELSAIWRAADKLGYPYGTIIKLLILTGQRRAEVTGMRWSEIDFEERLWVIPADRTKNGRGHKVPLTPMTFQLIQAIPRIGDIFVFPAKGNKENSFSGFSKLKRRVDELSATKDWTLHDLRRTVATQMACLGVLPHVVERLLNHTSGTFSGVAGVYNRFQYLHEIRSALEHREARLRVNFGLQ